MKNEINITEQKPMILVDVEKYENLIASKHYAIGKLSEIEKQLLLQEQIGFLKAENRMLKDNIERNTTTLYVAGENAKVLENDKIILECGKK